MHEEKHSLSSLRIAFLYFGVLMGAGFASGREIWQFFGVFGEQGLFGLVIVTLLFMVIGFVVVAISNKLNTKDLSKIILPFENPLGEKLIGGIVSSFLYMGYFSMLAAGGALVEEQFGIHRAIGSLFLMLLVAFTAVKGFHKVSQRIGKVTPLLLVSALLVSLIVIFKTTGSPDLSRVAAASPLTPNWFVAAIVFISYNMLGAIPILGSCTVYTDNLNKARIGAVLGGAFLGGCALIIYFATLTDPYISSESPLPMLTLSQGISPILRGVYAAVLVISVFGAATSCFYGFSTKVPEREYKDKLLWVSAVAGLAFSLLGFTRIVAIVYPMMGYVGFLLIAMMLINYARLKKGHRKC